MQEIKKFYKQLQRKKSRQTDKQINEQMDERYFIGPTLRGSKHKKSGVSNKNFLEREY